MGLLGSGAVAIWHDIVSEGRAIFYGWHGEEHMPERAAVPGFLRGRRYLALQGAPEFFNLYETAGTDVLSGPDYLERLNHPTPRTRAAVAHFRNVARSLCDVAASHGRGDGGLIATLRYDVAPDRAAGHRAVMQSRVAALAGEPGVAGAHFLVTDLAASGVETAERRARASATDTPGAVVLLEWWGDCDGLRERCAALVQDGAFAAAAAPPELGIYRLQNACARHDPGAPSGRS
ncbi:MAG: hypothetical protein ABI920_00290 [Casimicrobiaceae bacterium]